MGGRLGCATSAANPAEEVFRLAVVEMLDLCAEAAIKNPGSVKISAPATRIGGPSFSSGTLLGKEIGCMAVATDKTLGMVADGLEASMSATLTLLARELLSKHQEEVIKTYRSIIQGSRICGPIGLVRGKMPYGAAQYKAQKSDAIVAYFLKQSGGKLRDEMVKLVKPEVESRNVTKAFVDGLKRANSKMSHVDGASLSKDMSQHVAEQLVQQLGASMAKEEGELRKASAGKSKRPQTFAFCFSGQPLTAGLAKGAYGNRNR